MKAYWLLLLMLVLPGALAEVYDDRYAGIGIVLGVEQGSIVVKHILTNSPASASKEIHVGDRILAIAQDKEPAVEVENGRLAEAVHLCRGPKGTTVRLTIVPAGEDDFKSQ